MRWGVAYLHEKGAVEVVCGSGFGISVQAVICV